MVALRHLTTDERYEMQRELDRAQRDRARYAAQLNAQEIVLQNARANVWKLRQQIEACDTHIARFEGELERSEAA